MRRARSLLVLIALVLLIPFALAHNSDQHGPGKKHPPREMPPGRKSLVTGVTADPNPFSPNADGRLDASTIAVEAVVKAVDGLHARDHDRDDGDDGRASFYFAATAVIGDDVRRLRARSEIPRTHDRSVRVQTETAFDGNDETGRLLPDGDYDSTVLAFFLRERIKQGALSGEARSRLDDSIDALAGERNATIGLESKFEKRRKGRGEGSWRAEVRVDGIGKALRHKIRPLIEALEAALVAARQEVKAKIKLIDSEVVDGNALTIDTAAPALVSLLPPDGFASPSPEVEITGSLSEPATVSINDLPISLLPDLSFSATFPLSGGANLFTITAEDLAGNRTETTRTYLFDVTPPFIDIAEPIPGSFVPNNLPTIRVVYSDPEPSSGLDLSSLAILLDGTPLPLTPDRIGPTEAIFVPTDPLNDGEHTIEATISDKAPNVGTAGPYAFSIDTLPPTLTLSEPPDWLVTNRLSILVSGTSSEAGTVTVNSRTFPLAFAEIGGLTGVTGFIFPPALTPDATSPTGYVLSQSPLSYQGRDFDQLPNDEGEIIEDVALFLPTGFDPAGANMPVVLAQPFMPVPVDGLVSVHLALVEGSAGDRVTIYTTMERTELEAFLAMVDPVGATIWLYRQDAFLPQGPGAAYVFNPPPPGGGAGAWAFTTVEPLAEGANVISVFATDPAGHVSAPIVRRAILDSIPPVIRLDRPPQNFLTNRPSILVRGALSEEAEVWVNNIPIPLGGSPLPMVMDGFEQPSLVPGGSIPLVESFDSGLPADWSVVNLVGPPALVIPAQGALYVDTGPQAAGTSGSMLSIVRSPGAPVDVSQGFHLSIEFRVEILEGTGGFGVSLKGERGGVEESLMQARIGLDPSTLLPVAYLSATRPSGEQAMQIGLLGAIAPGTVLRFDLSYDAALHKVTAQMMDESRTLFDRSVGGFVVDFPVGVVLNVFAAEVGGGVAPGSVPLTSDSRVAVAIDNLVSDILVPGGYALSMPPMEIDGVAFADVLAPQGGLEPWQQGAVYLSYDGRPLPVIQAGTRIGDVTGREDVHVALVELRAQGARLTVLSRHRCVDIVSILQRTRDTTAGLAACVEPFLEARGESQAYALAPFDLPVEDPLGFQTRIVLPEGWHTITVTSRDRAGNEAIPVGRAVSVDLHPPRVVMDFPSAGFQTTQGEVTVRVSYTDSFTGVDPATLMISVNGADVTPPLPGPSFVEFTVEPGDGVHALYASISDRAGNTGQVGPTFFTVDTTPPEIVVDSPAPGAVITVSDVPFRVGYFDALVGVNVATLRIEVDGEDATPPLPGAYQVDFTRTLEDGTHTLTVSIADNLGNAATTGPIVFIVDTLLCDFAAFEAAPARADVYVPPPPAIVRTVGQVRHGGQALAPRRAEERDTETDPTAPPRVEILDPYGTFLKAGEPLRFSVSQDSPRVSFRAMWVPIPAGQARPGLAWAASPTEWHAPPPEGFSGQALVYIETYSEGRWATVGQHMVSVLSDEEDTGVLPAPLQAPSGGGPFHRAPARTREFTIVAPAVQYYQASDSDAGGRASDWIGFATDPRAIFCKDWRVDQHNGLTLSLVSPTPPFEFRTEDPLHLLSAWPPQAAYKPCYDADNHGQLFCDGELAAVQYPRTTCRDASESEMTFFAYHVSTHGQTGAFEGTNTRHWSSENADCGGWGTGDHEAAFNVKRRWEQQTFSVMVPSFGQGWRLKAASLGWAEGERPARLRMLDTLSRLGTRPTVNDRQATLVGESITEDYWWPIDPNRCPAPPPIVEMPGAYVPSKGTPSFRPQAVTKSAKVVYELDPEQFVPGWPGTLVVDWAPVEVNLTCAGSAQGKIPFCGFNYLGNAAVVCSCGPPIENCVWPCDVTTNADTAVTEFSHTVDSRVKKTEIILSGEVYLTYECDPEAEEAPKVITIERRVAGARLLPMGLPGVAGPTSETLRIKLSACERGTEPTDVVRNKTIEIRLRPSGLEGVDHSGGHDHNGNRPLGRIESGGVGRDCTAGAGDACMITCVTGNDGTCTVTYTAGEFSGVVVMNARYPDGEGAEQDVYILVGLGLIQLPDSPYYDKIGGRNEHLGPPGSADDHNHWGTPFTISVLQTIAREFFEATGVRMAINDISLPRGGGFDIHGEWNQDIDRPVCLQTGEGHCAHRAGDAVDVHKPVVAGCNPGTPNSAECVRQNELQQTLRDRMEDTCDVRKTYTTHWHIVCTGA